MMASQLAQLVLLFAATAQAATVDKKYARNLTLFHVNERNYSASPRNMNTADLNGDIYFDLRSRGLPLECGPWINESFWSRLDCSNPEVADISKLAVTRLVLEVDTRWAAYADCNIRDGVYSCSFEGCPDNCTALTARGKHECDRSNGCGWDDADGRCEVYGCANITSKLDCIQGYHRCVWEEGSAACSDPPGPPPKCNTSLVGFLNLSTVDWGQHPHPGHHESTVDYWHGNVLTKTYGNWYSTMPEGECTEDPAQTFCSWRLVNSTTKITKNCSDEAINAAILQGDRIAPWGARCFDGCSSADMRNASSECWIRCFYLNVLGPNGSTQLLNHSSPNFGIPVDELQAAWEAPFKPIEEGGCPRLP